MLAAEHGSVTADFGRGSRSAYVEDTERPKPSNADKSAFIAFLLTVIRNEQNSPTDR